jgi:hypothetical protein
VVYVYAIIDAGTAPPAETGFDGAALRALAALCLCGVLLLQVGGAIYKMRQDTYRNSYAPAINFLKQNASPSSLIMGSSALGFGLDFPDNLVDDVKFGYYSGRRADFIVIDPDYALTLPAFKEGQPEVAAYINRLVVKDYRLAYNDGSYRIYARR